MKRLLQLLPFLLLCAAVLGMNANAQTNDAVPDAMITSAGPSVAASLDRSPSALLSQWGELSPLPGAKCYHGAAYHDGFIYVFGGLGGDLRYDMKSYKYEIATDTWSAIANLPLQRGLPTVQTVGDKIYIIGGYSNTNPFTVQNAVLEYDPAADTYTEKANMFLPVFGAGSFVSDDRIWVLGGGTSAFTTSNNAIQIYNPATDSWTFSLSLTPYASWGTGVAVVGSTALYVGGVRYVSGQGTFGAWAYKGTIAGDEITWTQIPDYPGASTMRHAAGSDGSKAYFAGGYNSGSMNSGPPTGKTYAYDPATNVWSMKDVKPTPVYFASQMVFDGDKKLYVSGGNNTAQTVTAAFEALDVEAEGGPIALFDRTEVEVWLKDGGNTAEKVAIKNNGSAALVWNASVSSGDTWLTVNVASGVVEPGETSDIPFRVTTTEGIGTHDGALTVTTNDPQNASVSIDVTLIVQAEETDTEMNVLLEEGTGTWCGFCPFGADTVKALVHDYPGRVFAIAYHGGSVTEPMHTSHTDFWTNVVQLSGWPNASVNRILFPGQAKVAMSRPFWRESVLDILHNRRSPISLDIVSKSYDAVTKRVELTVEVFFHRGFEQPLRLNVAQVQNQMNYTQVFYPPSGGSTKLFPYMHDHVLRQVVPNDAGEIVVGGSAVASQTKVTRTIAFTSVDSTVGTSSFVIYAHLSDGVTFGEVVQCEELEMASFVTDVRPLPADASFALHANYPNPFNPSTMLSFDVPLRSAVTLTVSDALGRVVATPAEGWYDAGRHSLSFSGSALPSGNYFLTLRAGDFVQTRTITLMK
jgi:N-acetylneuraminic acid mutarotase